MLKPTKPNKKERDKDKDELRPADGLKKRPDPSTAQIPSGHGDKAGPSVIKQPLVTPPNLSVRQIPEIGKGILEPQPVTTTLVASTPSFQNTQVPATPPAQELKPSALVSELVPVDPTTGLAPEFANALKLSRELPDRSVVPVTRPLLGYLSPPTTIEVPVTWAVRLLENPPPFVRCYTKTIFALGRDEPTYAISLSTDIVQYLMEPTQAAFYRGMNLSYYQLNPDLFAGRGLGMTAGAFLGSSFVGPFLFSGGSEDIQCDVVQFVSGAVCASAMAILTYYGRLVLDRTEMRSVSGIGEVADMSWLQKNWTSLAVPNPAMYYGRSCASYVDDSLLLRERFRYGRIDAITLGPGNFPLTSRWATTYDNFAVEMLGIAQRYINQNVISQAALESLLRAHSPHGTTFIRSNVDPRTSQPFLLGNPTMMLGQLFYAIARQPSLKGVIYNCYTEYILHSGLVRVEPLSDVLGGTSFATQAMSVGHEFSRSW